MAETKEGRRDWLAKVAMGVGLLLSYGTLAAQSLLFLLPKQLKAARRRLFAGTVQQFPMNGVKPYHDLEGNEILVKRTSAGFEAFDSTCPHLGCKVHWVPEGAHFFCPCHNGIFDQNGNAISGPPADAGQSLAQVELVVDDEAGSVFIDVKEPKGRKT